MLDQLDDGSDWEHIDLVKFAVYGSAFTVGLDLLIYPLQVISTKLQVETKARKGSK